MNYEMNYDYYRRAGKHVKFEKGYNIKETASIFTALIGVLTCIFFLIVGVYGTINLIDNFNTTSFKNEVKKLEVTKVKFNNYNRLYSQGENRFGYNYYQSLV